MGQGTPACCLPGQISFSAPISSARGGIGRPFFCFVLWRKSPRRIFALCPVAVAYSAACSRLRIRMQQIGRMAEHPRRSRLREWLPDRFWCDASRVCPPRGCSDFLILQARDLRGHVLELQYETRVDDEPASFAGGQQQRFVPCAPRFRHAVTQT